MMIKVILVDDEIMALQALQWQIQNFCQGVEVLAACDNVAAATQAIHTLKPDVVFLDIEMPVQNGFDLLKQFYEIPFEVIFTTAYDRFALKAIKFSALDYLLKPIDPYELQSAIQKVIQKKEKGQARQQFDMLLHNYLHQQKKQTQFALPSSDGIIFMEADQIIRCESESNYTWIYLTDRQKILLPKTLKDIEMLLEGDDFFRVHHSHLINIRHIKKYSKKEGGGLVMKDDSEVPISRNRKDAFLELFKKL